MYGMMSAVSLCGLSFDFGLECTTLSMNAQCWELVRVCCSVDWSGVVAESVAGLLKCLILSCILVNFGFSACFRSEDFFEKDKRLGPGAEGPRCRVSTPLFREFFFFQRCGFTFLAAASRLVVLGQLCHPRGSLSALSSIASK